MKKSLLSVLLLILMILAASSAAAQSSNRDHPTPLLSNEVSGELRGHGREMFYSFTAGPGELTITLDVKSSEGTLALPYEILAANGADALLCCEYAQADATGETGRSVKSVRLKRRQTVILHLTESQSDYAKGTFHVRLSGPVAFSEGPSGGVSEDRAGRDDHNRMGLPASGTLRIKMKDGSTKEIDLSLVRNVSVQP